jgi:hypothetical protein
MQTFSRSSRFFLAAALAVCFSATVAGAQDYKIKLNRPSKVGDESTAHITTKFKQEMSGNPAGSQEFTVELQGTLKTLAVNDKTGAATKLSCTVKKLTKDGNELYPPGTVIVGEKVNKADTFTIDGNPVDAANVPALSAVLELADPDRSTTDDEIYGTDKPQPIGGSWPISADKMAAELTGEGLPVPAESLKGEVKLTDVTKVDNVDALMMNMHISADGFNSTVPGANITDGKLDVTGDSVVPVDESLQGLSLKVKMHMSMTVTPDNGGPAATLTIDRETNQEQRPVEK